MYKTVAPRVEIMIAGVATLKARISLTTTALIILEGFLPTQNPEQMKRTEMPQILGVPFVGKPEEKGRSTMLCSEEKDGQRLSVVVF